MLYGMQYLATATCPKDDYEGCGTNLRSTSAEGGDSPVSTHLAALRQGTSSKTMMLFVPAQDMLLPSPRRSALPTFRFRLRAHSENSALLATADRGASTQSK